jgi:glutathione peroxidase
MYTPQEAGLQVLEETFNPQGFQVLGFLSDDFGSQAGSAGQMSACNKKYGISFLQFAVADVIPENGAPPQPVFAWLEMQPNPGPSTTILPTWNFAKYLISRTGALVGHWDPAVYPGMDPSDPTSTFDNSAIVIAIRAELAK